MNIQFKSKFNLEDVVWFMYENKPVQGIIHRIIYERRESVDISCRHESIFTRLKSYLEGAKIEVRLIYELDKIKENGEFSSSSHRRCEDEIFKSKEELLKSL